MYYHLLFPVIYFFAICFGLTVVRRVWVLKKFRNVSCTVIVKSKVVLITFRKMFNFENMTWGSTDKSSASVFGVDESRQALVVSRTERAE